MVSSFRNSITPNTIIIKKMVVRSLLFGDGRLRCDRFCGGEFGVRSLYYYLPTFKISL
ncbi:hypothetical protein [Planktothrix agardhii]|uniref:hypothetical protein n=1 Tax=Planktothrix agardhii TaxID=1160 RepID=UPI0020A7A0EB|nr:hypothetical protein [Planktothrix agardhii]